VFVVDNELLIASTLTRILEANGYDAHCFVNPLEAIEPLGRQRPTSLYPM
jgi:CheY-like chemotaxis protein